MILLELFYLPKTFPLISLVVIALFTVVFYIMQMWSLIISRIISRLVLVLLLVMVIFALVAWVLGTLKIYKPDYTMVVVAALVVGLVLSVISMVFFRVKSTTYDYIQETA